MLQGQDNHQSASFPVGATCGSPSACHQEQVQGHVGELLHTHHFRECSLVVFLVKLQGLPWRGETAGKTLTGLRGSMGRSSLPVWGASSTAHLQGMQRPSLAASLTTSPSSFFPWRSLQHTHVQHEPICSQHCSCQLLALLPFAHFSATPLFFLSSPLYTRYLLSACIQLLPLRFSPCSVCFRSSRSHH